LRESERNPQGEDSVEAFPLRAEEESESEILLLVSAMVRVVESFSQLVRRTSVAHWTDYLVAHNYLGSQAFRCLRKARGLEPLPAIAMGGRGEIFMLQTSARTLTRTRNKRYKYYNIKLFPSPTSPPAPSIVNR